ncbi:hypothetical protein GALMADRAFT_1242568, partial [Galerina marginata CBS 339.88]
MATPDVTIFDDLPENQPVTEIISFSVIGYSTLDLIMSITEYVVSQVDTLVVVENAATTTTLATTPILVTCESPLL